MVSPIISEMLHIRQWSTHNHIPHRYEYTGFSMNKVNCIPSLSLLSHVIRTAQHKLKCFVTELASIAPLTV